MVKRMQAYPGLIGQIGKSNAKNIPIPNTDNTIAEIRKSITTLLKQIQQIKRANDDQTHTDEHQTLETLIMNVTNTTMAKAKRITDKIKEARDETRECDEQDITVEQVYGTRRKLKNTVISIIDKANASLVVM